MIRTFISFDKMCEMVEIMDSNDRDFFVELGENSDMDTMVIDSNGVYSNNYISVYDVVLLLSYDEKSIFKILDIFKNYLIKFEYVDFTEDAIMDTLDIDKIFGSENYNGIRMMLDKYIDSNLTCDVVLDKISKHKISSLSIKDYSLLEDKDVKVYFSEYN